MRYLWAGLVCWWLASLIGLSWMRAETWTDELPLWESAAWWSPAKLRPTVELGRLHMLAGHLDRAEQDFQHALVLWERGRPAFERPGCELARENLVRLLTLQGRFAEAEHWSAYSCVGPSSSF